MGDAGGEAGVVLFLGVEDVFFPTNPGDRQKNQINKKLFRLCTI